MPEALIIRFPTRSRLWRRSDDGHRGGLLRACAPPQASQPGLPGKPAGWVTAGTGRRTREWEYLISGASRNA